MRVAADTVACPPACPGLDPRVESPAAAVVLRQDLEVLRQDLEAIAAAIAKQEQMAGQRARDQRKALTVARTIVLKETAHIRVRPQTHDHVDQKWRCRGIGEHAAWRRARLASHRGARVRDQHRPQRTSRGVSHARRGAQCRTCGGGSQERRCVADRGSDACRQGRPPSPIGRADIDTELIEGLREAAERRAACGFSSTLILATATWPCGAPEPLP
jgi:hypothetical protein